MSDLCRPNGTPGKSVAPKLSSEQKAKVSASRGARSEQRSALYAALRNQEITPAEFGARIREVGFH